jgi:hypothetical protein
VPLCEILQKNILIKFYFDDHWSELWNDQVIEWVHTYYDSLFLDDLNYLKHWSKSNELSYMDSSSMPYFKNILCDHDTAENLILLQTFTCAIFSKYNYSPSIHLVYLNTCYL